MRLKKIILEKIQNEEVEKLYRELKGGEHLLTKEKLYRGMSTKVETYILRTSRKGRVPKATPKTADTFINTLSNNFFSEHPQRNKGTFGSPHKRFAAHFGTTVNLIIPKKSAKVKFYEHDTWPRYTSSIGNKLNAGSRKLNNLSMSLERNTLGRKFEKLRNEYDKDVIDFIYGVWEMKTHEDNGIFRDVVNNFTRFVNLYGKLKSFVKNDKAREELESEIILAAEKFLKALNVFKDYITEGHEEYHTNSREVIIEGDHLIINPNWFKNYFLWNEGNVKLKENQSEV